MLFCVIAAPPMQQQLSCVFIWCNHGSAGLCWTWTWAPEWRKNTFPCILTWLGGRNEHFTGLIIPSHLCCWSSPPGLEGQFWPVHLFVCPYVAVCVCVYLNKLALMECSWPQTNCVYLYTRQTSQRFSRWTRTHQRRKPKQTANTSTETGLSYRIKNNRNETKKN